jgi:glycogen debranching enzyme
MSLDEPGERRGLLPRFTLKDENTFLLADALGDVHSSDDGLFTDDTRMLSRWELALAGRRPSLLGAAISQENTLFTAHLTNRPLAAPGELALPKGVIHIERSRFLHGSRLYERLRLTNYGERDVAVPLKLLFAADFMDIFEVQGHARKERGVHLPIAVDARGVCLAYRGRDDVVRTSRIQFSLEPSSLTDREADFHMDVLRGAHVDLFVEIGAESERAPSADRFNVALQELSTAMQGRLRQGATITTTGRLFNLWIDRSRADLALLTTALPTGLYPYAGIPWFATQFGRDAIITALQTLWINPELARGVLSFLASTQATEESTFRDSQPGKIMHETRRGEMASLGEVPFGCYYGGVDTTPLFVMAIAKSSIGSGPHSSKRPNGSSDAWTTALPDFSITRAANRAGSSTRRGKTATIRFFTLTATPLRIHWQSSKCRAMPARPCVRWRSLRPFAAIRRAAMRGANEASSYASPSSGVSGCRR